MHWACISESQEQGQEYNTRYGTYTDPRLVRNKQKNLNNLEEQQK